MFYHSSKNYELLRASRQDGKLIQRVRSTVPEDYKIRLLLREPLLYTYQNEVYYKNPLKNVICVLRDGLKQYRRYELNIGMVDNENRDDYFNPKKNRNMINIAGVYETEDFLLFFMVIKRKLIGCCVPSKTGCARLIIMKIVSQMTFPLVKKSLFVVRLLLLLSVI